MTADYEAEQERLKLEIGATEEWVEQRQAMGDAFIVLTKEYMDVTELTQTIVYQEDHHSRTGQVLRQAQTEDGDHLQLCRQCGYSRYFRAYCHTNNL